MGLIGEMGKAVKFARSEMGKMTRKINDRMKKLSKELGPNSPVVEKEKAKIDKLIPKNHLRYDKNGALQIVGPKSLEGEVSLEDMADLVERGETWGEIKRKNWRGYKEQKEKQPEEEREDYKFSDYVNDVYDMFNKLPDIYRQIQDDKDIDDGSDEMGLLIEAGEKFMTAIHSPQNLQSALFNAKIVMGG